MTIPRPASSPNIVRKDPLSLEKAIISYPFPNNNEEQLLSSSPPSPPPQLAPFQSDLLYAQRKVVRFEEDENPLLDNNNKVTLKIILSFLTLQEIGTLQATSWRMNRRIVKIVGLTVDATSFVHHLYHQCQCCSIQTTVRLCQKLATLNVSSLCIRNIQNKLDPDYLDLQVCSKLERVHFCNFWKLTNTHVRFFQLYAKNLVSIQLQECPLVTTITKSKDATHLTAATVAPTNTTTTTTPPKGGVDNKKVASSSSSPPPPLLSLFAQL